jgi:hypothetical protein
VCVTARRLNRFAKTALSPRLAVLFLLRVGLKS